jgi:hypothetical protein
MRFRAAIVLASAYLAVQTPATTRSASVCPYWTQGAGSKSALEAAGITRICVPAAQADAWRSSGLDVVGVTDADLAARETLQVPGVVARPGVASPTRAPWIATNGSRFMRAPDGKYLYDAPAGKAALAAAEAFTYGADALVKIDPADAGPFGSMQAFFGTLPTSDLPPVADLAVVDDGSPVTGEAMNLLVRRNLLFEIVKAPSAKHRVNVAIGSPDFPAKDAADPSAFAQRIRQQLTDEQRSLRIFGSEVVVGRLTSDGSRARIQLLNYGGRDIEGLRVRLRGALTPTAARVAGVEATTPSDVTVADGFTEFSVPKLTTYGVIDLSAAK